MRHNWKAQESETNKGFDYQDNQRRKLIEAWACADQAFREVGTGKLNLFIKALEQ